MVTTWIQILEQLGDARLERWARDIHWVVLAAFAVYGLAPLIAAMMRYMSTRPERLWVRMWICPSCEHLNRSTYPNCQRCEHTLPLRWRDRWQASSFAESLRDAGRRLNKTTHWAGYFLYYTIPAVALVAFELYRFQQSPLQEMAGSLALGFLLLFFLFVRVALDAGWRKPVASLLNLIAGAAMMGGFLGASFLWAAAPALPTSPWVQYLVKHLQPRVVTLQQTWFGTLSRSAEVIVPAPTLAKPVKKTKK